MIAEHLGRLGWLLRSGGALGADMAFQVGAQRATNTSEIFTAKDSETRPWWQEHAARHHPNWPACSRYARLLHARNSAIILGSSFKAPVDCVVCWTPNGEVIGGTGQALRVAKASKLPIFNFGDETGAQFWNWLTAQ